MRILYGVHGYGRGHATRTLAVLPHLAARHHVLILAGGDAYQTISPAYQVVRIPTLAFAYNQGPGPRRRSNRQTLRRNLPAVLDLLWQGPTFELVA
jgi:UDP:flavonoid glycosyltransferase YjiC (YdhE family)